MPNPSLASRSASGFCSVGIGALSIVSISAAKHYETFRGTGSSYLLNTLYHYGFVREATPGAEPELRASGPIFPLTDESVLRGLLMYGIYLATVSVLLAVWAEHRREDNLLLSAGFMCGAGGLYLANNLVGIIALVAGFAAVLFLRHARQNNREVNRET